MEIKGFQFTANKNEAIITINTKMGKQLLLDITGTIDRDMFFNRNVYSYFSEVGENINDYDKITIDLVGEDATVCIKYDMKYRPKSPMQRFLDENK